jgi:predicted ATPase/DNA-binding SARP family transcriptional activator
VSASADLEFRILGPLEVLAGGESLPLGGTKQRATLAVLLVHANEPVSNDRLIDSLWGSRPPATAKTALQGYITSLRRLLEPTRTKRAAADVLVTTPAGYLLRVGDGALDRHAFEALAARGHEALAAGRFAEAAELTRSALELWRGPALAEFAYEAWAHAETERLAELRLASLEERIEAELELGRHGELVPELESIVAEHPLRERPRAQLMRALYRAGRQAEALEVYQQTRQVLVNELGIDPSPELRELEAAILRQDEKLDAPLRPALPEGTVTLLSTDVEGSTRLLHELGPEQYREALHRHRQILREVFTRHGGVEVDTQGDAFLISFPTAPDAIRMAQEATHALASGPIRVRIGVHTGAPLLTAEGYVGVDVHRVARIADAGHGGQVLVSESTARLAESPNLVDLGEYRLKDLTAPVRLYQLGDAAFPPLRTLHQTNLPVQTSPLVGRQRELRDVLSRLSEARLVTLTGAGGSGKTRLALQAAADLVEDYPDGVWWVSLSALRDAELVEPTIAQVVGARYGLAEHLRERRALLLLDNLEHLLEAAPRIAQLLAEAPNVRVLATSRERLGIAGEHEYVVPTMDPIEAVALFTARARQLSAAFEPDEAVLQICRRLDGLPLAIELAAARIKVLRPDQILERLGKSLGLLTAGARDAPERQRTLRATIAWSYDLLNAADQTLFARLAVFRGSFDLAAAETICAAEIDTLAALVDKSLLRRTQEGRFFMLETIREYANECLDASGEDGLHRRHAKYCVALVEPLAYDVRDLESEAIARLDADRDNIRAAVTWAIESNERELAERILNSLWFYWLTRGQVEEADGLARQILELSAPSTPIVSADAIAIAAEFARYRGELDRAASLKEAAIEAFRSLDWSEGLTPTLTDLAHIEAKRGNFERARSLADEALARRREELIRGEGFKGGIAHALFAIAHIEFREGNIHAAERTLEEVIEESRRDEDWANLPEELAALAQVKRCLGTRDEALAALREGLPLARAIGQRAALCECLEILALLTLDAGKPAPAATLLGCVERLRGEVGFADFFDSTEHERALAHAKADLDEDAFESLLREGRELETEDAVELALDVAFSGA